MDDVLRYKRLDGVSETLTRLADAVFANGQQRERPAEGFDPAKVPTLVIWGEADEVLLPGLLDGLDRYVADLTIKRIPEGSHWVVHEQPATINGLIREFLRQRA